MFTLTHVFVIATVIFIVSAVLSAVIHLVFIFHMLIKYKWVIALDTSDFIFRISPNIMPSFRMMLYLFWI